MKTLLFQWAAKQGFSLGQLAEMTGYSTRHLLRIKAKGNSASEEFAAHIIFHLGDWSRSLFLPAMSLEADAASGQSGVAQIAPTARSAAPSASNPAGESLSTCEAAEGALVASEAMAP